MTFLTWIMGTRVGRLLSSLLAGAVIILAAFQYGRQTQKTKERVKDLEDYVETKKEIDDVETSVDSDAAFERLRDNGWLR